MVLFSFFLLQYLSSHSPLIRAPLPHFSIKRIHICYFPIYLPYSQNFRGRVQVLALTSYVTSKIISEAQFVILTKKFQISLILYLIQLEFLRKVLLWHYFLTSLILPVCDLWQPCFCEPEKGIAMELLLLLQIKDTNKGAEWHFEK